MTIRLYFALLSAWKVLGMLWLACLATLFIGLSGAALTVVVGLMTVATVTGFALIPVLLGLGAWNVRAWKLSTRQ